MLGGIRGHRAAPQSPPPVSPETLAGAAALGQSSGSGSVAPHNAFPTAPLTPTAVHELVPSQHQPTVDLPPDSIYTDRAMRGGVASLSAFGQFHEGAPFTGGYRVMAGRPALGQYEGEQIEAQEFAQVAEYRDAPAVTTLCRTIPSVLTAGGLTDVPEV